MSRQRSWIFVISVLLILSVAPSLAYAGAQTKPAKAVSKAKQASPAKQAADKETATVMNQDMVQQKRDFYDFCLQLMSRKHASPTAAANKEVQYDHDNLVYTFENPKEFTEFKKKCEEKCNQGWEVYGARTLSRSNREQVLFRKPRTEPSPAKEEKKGSSKSSSPPIKASPAQAVAKDKAKAGASPATPIKRPFEAVQD